MPPPPPTLLPGKPYPLGASWDGLGVNFAVFSAHAERIDLLSEAARLNTVAEKPNEFHAHITLAFQEQVRGGYSQNVTTPLPHNLRHAFIRMAVADLRRRQALLRIELEKLR